jgi:GTP pyrophosphokinase
MSDLEALRNLVLAPYIIQAMDLIWVGRKGGGNQFRHSFATLGILLDYKYFHDPVLLKAALMHDLFEDLPETQLEKIRQIDSDGPAVVELVLEVTRRHEESKSHFLKRILEEGSNNAKVLKSADRISNLTDLHLDTHSGEKITAILDHTEEFIIPMAMQVNDDFVRELTDLVKKRRELSRKEENCQS